MKELFDLLNETEKKIILALAALAAAAALFFFLGSLPQKRVYGRAQSSLKPTEARYDQASQKSLEKKEEWLRWQQAREDMEELEKDYFYEEKDVTPQLRLDLERIFSEAGVNISRLKYNYSEFKKENIGKVNVAFNLTGSYASLKKFIHTVEKFPKFLVLEKIDFLDVNPARQTVELKVTLAGYYGS